MGKRNRSGVRKTAEAGDGAAPVVTGDEWLDGGTPLQVMKAMSVGVEDTQMWGAESLGEDEWSERGFVSPPMPMDGLWVVYVNSNVLRQCMAAYFSTVDAFGAAVVPILSPEAEDFEEKLAELVFEDRVWRYEQGEESGEPQYPEGDDLEEAKTAYMARLRFELASCRVWMRNCVDKGRSLVYLRGRIRDEWVGLGNAAVEVMRDAGDEDGPGGPARFSWVSMLRLRPTKQDEQAVEIEEKIRVGLRIETRKVWRRFRRWAQVLASGREIWFKEYGDHRIMSRATGTYFADRGAWEKHLSELREDEGQDHEATEIYHFVIPDSRSVWGFPLWYGALRSVMGSTAMEDVNLLHFSEAGIPPYVVMVNGGKLKGGSADVIAEHFRKIKGRKARHKVLILEALPPKGKGGVNAGSTGKVEIVMERLFQPNEAAFIEYDKENRDKAAETMRVPRILRAAGGDYNRATAMAALAMFENMVAGPQREAWDDEFDTFCRDRGYRLIRTRSRSPITRDPETQAKIVEILAKAGGLVPGEVREQAADILNADLPEIHEPWTKQPMLFTLAGISPDGEGGADGEGAGDDVQGTQATRGVDPSRLNEAVNRVVALRNALADGLGGAEDLRNAAGGDDVVRLEIPWTEMVRMVSSADGDGDGDEG